MTDWLRALALLSYFVAPVQAAYAVEPIRSGDIDKFREQISRCFDEGNLSYEPNAEKLYVILSFGLSPDGSLSTPPKIEHLGPHPSNLLALAAIKGIKDCAPYTMLPADNYQAWSVVQARFSVAGMQ